MKTYIGNNCTVELQSFEKSVHAIVEDQTAHAEREGEDGAFILCDLGSVIAKYDQWVEKMPRVKPFYAVKCNDDIAVLKVLAECGANFDCASRGEIQKVLGIGVSPSRIIYANPCKQSSMIKYAAKNKVSMMTFDNASELHKIKEYYPEAKLVLRILPPSNFKVKCNLGIKFGVLPSKAAGLLQEAYSLKLDVIGISFHVGSGCQEAGAFVAAIQQAREVFDIAHNIGFKMDLLDIGGGYPGSNDCAFIEIIDAARMALDKYFPVEEGVELIAEPGRYFVASAFTLGVNIIAKRIVTKDQQDAVEGQSVQEEKQAIMYYVNDGVYGSFNCLLYDHAEVSVNTLKHMEEETTYESSIWGPTCDGIDCILRNVHLPMHNVGQWFYFKDMGAYTVAAASTFNGMPVPKRHYYCISDTWHKVFPEVRKVKRCRPIRVAPSMKTGHSLKDTSFDGHVETLMVTEKSNCQ